MLCEFSPFNTSSKSTRKQPLDESIYDALTPSVSGFQTPDGKPFGKTLIFSSPNRKKRKFWFEYSSAFKLGVNSGTLALNAPTWEMNKTVHSAYLKSAWAKNPSGYLQEYGASFSEGGEKWLQEYGIFYRSVDLRLHSKSMVGRIDRRYFLGVDFALSNDGTAAAICHFEPEFEEKLKYFPPEIHSYYKDLNQEFIDEDTVVVGGKFDLELSEGVKALLQNNATYEDFTELGYSEGVVYDLLIF